MKKLLTIIAFILILCISALAADTVYVSSKGDDSAAGTADAPFETMYTAFRALPYGGTVVLMNKIEMDLTEFPATEGIVTITSYDGTTDYRSKGAKLTLNKNLTLKGAVNFEKINLEVADSSVGIICNGNYTRFGENINMIKSSASIAYPNLVVGSQGLVGSNGGFLEIHSGTFNRIYGGASSSNSAAQSGDMVIAIYGGTVEGTFYLTGLTEFNGTQNVYIYGGTFLSGLAASSTSDVSGSVNLTIYGGEFGADSYLRPASSGIMSGECIFNVLGGNVNKIYNVSDGKITGKVEINLASGISLTHNPFSSQTSTLSNIELEQIKSEKNNELSLAKAEIAPTDTVNPLTSRDNKYKGIANKATVFKKKIAGGDLNDDGIITLFDALRSFKASFGEYNKAADINEDCEISTLDCLLILQSALDTNELITEYTVNNSISRLVRYGNAVVTDNTFDTGYVFGSTEDTSYTVSSKVSLGENGIVGIYYGCNNATPTMTSGYYFEVNAKDETMKVYKIENSIYRVVAEKKLHLLSTDAEIKITYGKTLENAAQFYFNDNPLITDFYFDFDLILPSMGKGIGMYVENATATTPLVTTEMPISTENTYTNPTIGNITDPEIFYEDGIYYIYGTKSGGASDGVQCFATSDFVTFEDKGIVLNKADAFGDQAIVAANIIKLDNVYYMFYLQESLKLGINTTGFATASSPTGPFVTEEKVPLVSGTDIIGGQPFLDDDGTVYLVYTRITGGNQTYVSKVNLENGKAELDLTTEAKLLAPTEDWEYAKASVVECGFIIKHSGTYYLIYAGGNYNSTYGVGYATSDNVYGPYTKYEYNPILWSNDQAFGNGAASVFVSPDMSEHFIIYLRNNGHTVTRPLNTCIDRIRFVPNPAGGPDILEIEGASVSPRPLPSGIGSNTVFDYQNARWHW